MRMPSPIMQLKPGGKWQQPHDQFIMKQTNHHSLKFCVGRFAKGSEGGLQLIWLDRTSGELKEGARFGDGQVFFCAADSGHLYSLRASAFNQGPDPEELLAWELSSGASIPKLLGRQPTGGRASCYLGIVPNGGPALLAHYGSSGLSAISRQRSGGLDATPARWEQCLEGASIHPKRQCEPHPHCFISTPLENPNEMALYAADLGSDRIQCYRYNVITGLVVPAEKPYLDLPPGAGPRHLALHPNGKWLYCLNELSNSLSVLQRECRTGELSYRGEVGTLPEAFQGDSFAGDLVVTPNGRFLYATNRGHDSIVGFDLGEPGSPHRSFIVSSGAAGPQNLAISSDGQWLLCAHLAGHRIVSYEVRESSGQLRPVGTGINVTNPACLSEV